MAQGPEEQTRRALEQGKRQSREAVARPVRDPMHLVLWRRYKWKVLGLLFLLLTELCLLLLGKTIVMGPG
jgi:hypothetical protein